MVVRNCEKRVLVQLFDLFTSSLCFCFFQICKCNFIRHRHHLGFNFSFVDDSPLCYFFTPLREESLDFAEGKNLCL